MLLTHDRFCFLPDLPPQPWCPAARPDRMKPAPSPESIEQAETDAHLLHQSARGDRAAFARLYDRFSRPLYTVALRILNDPAEAQDIVQEIFLTLWEKAGAFETSRGTAFSWAVTLTRNRAIDRLRTRKRRFELLHDSPREDLGYAGESHDRTSADDLWLKEKAGAVRAAVDALPSDQKAALELAFFGGLTQQEIAARLQEPLGTVKARIRRGLLKLRETVSRRL